MKFIKKFIPGFLKKGYRKYKKRRELKSYEGDKVLCPICNSRFKKFAPYGSPVRKNAKCMNCGSLERHRLLYLYFKEKTNLFDEKAKIKLLHFAPEKAFYEIFSKSKSIEYVPGDFSPER